MSNENYMFHVILHNHLRNILYTFTQYVTQGEQKLHTVGGYLTQFIKTNK